MVVYTVCSCDLIGPDEPSPHCCAGSYTNRAAALEGLAAYVMERLGMGRADLADAMAHDRNHPLAKGFFVKHRSGETAVRRGCLGRLRAFLLAAVQADGRYYVDDGTGAEWLFEVEENKLAGEEWSLVTWGDSDVEDPEFTRPFPELFTDEDKAVANAVQYAKDLMESHDFSKEDAGSILAYIRDALRLSGQARLDLNDGTAVHWVLYHFGMETENTDGK